MKTHDWLVRAAHRRGWEDGMNESLYRPWGVEDPTTREERYRDSLNKLEWDLQQPLQPQEKESDGKHRGTPPTR